ncbi:hypothetical protein FACS1894217_13100 [Clostridia bacterium]|nr:hypothetical protein FACS1894217_13100 [Clostridia bacterium]
MRKFLVSALLTATLLALTITASLAAEAYLGEVNAEGVNFREAPAANAKIITEFAGGTELLITDTATKSGHTWYEVSNGDKLGYVSANYITILEDNDFDAVDGVVYGSNVNVRIAPTTNAKAFASLNQNTKVAIVGTFLGWYKIDLGDGTTGYMHPNMIKTTAAAKAAEVKAAAEKAAADAAAKAAKAAADKAAKAAKQVTVVAPVMEAAPAPVADSAATSGTRAELVAFALQYKGARYVYGSMNPAVGFDCSGFTSYVFKHFGYSLNRSSSGQLANGVKISKSELQPGDLLLFRDTKVGSAAATHAGLYIGDGLMIHASGKKTGVKIDSINSAYYISCFVGARRILP